VELLEAADLGALYLAYGQQRPWLNPIMVGLTHTGNVEVLLAVVLTAVVCFLGMGWRRGALALVVAGLSALLLSEGVKQLVGRERPNVAWRLIDLPASPSFPSGHALGSMAIYGTLGWLVARRWGAIIGAVLAVVIGLTRLYVGVHYPSDVLAGLLAGGAVVAVAAQVAGERPELSAKPDGPAVMDTQAKTPSGGSHAVDSEQRPNRDV
jgi:undecaprenyl-diphosphatase